MISVIIVNWNAGRQLKNCLDSICKNSTGFAVQIIVVDNNSSDGSEIFAEFCAEAKLIKSDVNLGFGKACNLGAMAADGDYFLFLNPDAALYPDTIGKAISYMSNPQNNRVGICGVQLIEENGHVARSCSRFPQAWHFVFHALGVDRLNPRLGHFMNEWPHDDTREVDHVIGAFFLVRSSVFFQLNGFDERFFVYLEDLDFSYRASQAGWSSVFLADVKAFHAGGGTSRSIKARRMFYSLRSRLLYAFKHFSLPNAYLVLLMTLLLEPISRLLLAVAKMSYSSFKETLSGYGMLWRWLPQWLFKGITR